MISQHFRSLPKFVYVGDTSGFRTDKKPLVHSRYMQFNPKDWDWWYHKFFWPIKITGMLEISNQFETSKSLWYRRNRRFQYKTRNTTSGIDQYNYSSQRSQSLLCLFQVRFSFALFVKLNSLGDIFSCLFGSFLCLVQESKIETGRPLEGFGADFFCNLNRLD